MTSTSRSLLDIDLELQHQTAGLSDPLLEVCRFATSGGRRTRALLLLRAAQQSGPRSIQAATALEMIHAATLLQDDIFDDGELRRGQATAHLRFGKALTILASDWLIVRALELAGEVDHFFFRCLARAATSMAQAEAREFAPPQIHSFEEAQSYGGAIALGKTAALFGTALCGAAILVGVSLEDRARWEQLGVEMGMTYQLVDDCLDVYGVEAAAGKSLGHDLAAGCLTLPMLLATRSLEALGNPISLKDLQTGRLPISELLRLKSAISSANVLRQIADILLSRFAAHRRESANARMPASAIDAWQTDLIVRLGPSFRAVSPKVVLRTDQEPSFAPGDFQASWESYA